jgi:hypothetical protein
MIRAPDASMGGNDRGLVLGLAGILVARDRQRLDPELAGVFQPLASGLSEITETILAGNPESSEAAIRAPMFDPRPEIITATGTFG